MSAASLPATADNRTVMLTPRQTVAVLIAFAAGSCTLAAKDRHKAAIPASQDQIAVEAHISVSGAAITRFVATRHYDRLYVYAERGPGQPVTLLDLSAPAKPAVISQVDASTLVAVAGTAALAGSAPAPTAIAPPQTLRLMDLSDPSLPKVTRQFDGVTAVEKVAGNLILLANAEGVWILSQRLAEDPATNERYARKVIYGESMY